MWIEVEYKTQKKEMINLDLLESIEEYQMGRMTRVWYHGDERGSVYDIPYEEFKRRISDVQRGLVTLREEQRDDY